MSSIVQSFLDVSEENSRGVFKPAEEKIEEQKSQRLNLILQPSVVAAAKKKIEEENRARKKNSLKPITLNGLINDFLKQWVEE